MIEFTLSRVVLIICGAAILGTVFVPIQSLCEYRYDESMSDAADRISFIIDEFWASEADTLTVRGWEILPPGGYIEIEGHHLAVHAGDVSYRSLISKEMDRVVFGYGDEVSISKN
ncbi:MAG: hypothetical protein LBJ20_02415 [Candidatus Methanoplasma sp.]|jgi:hypothetical protein|nr:hypothetical protein [Candidatus Methanoplasma sp.]